MHTHAHTHVCSLGTELWALILAQPFSICVSTSELLTSLSFSFFLYKMKILTVTFPQKRRGDVLMLSERWSPSTQPGLVPSCLLDERCGISQIPLGSKKGTQMDGEWGKQVTIFQMCLSSHCCVARLPRPHRPCPGLSTPSCLEEEGCAGSTRSQCPSPALSCQPLALPAQRPSANWALFRPKCKWSTWRSFGALALRIHNEKAMGQCQATRKPNLDPSGENQSFPG